MGARLRGGDVGKVAEVSHNPHNLSAGHLMAQLRDKYPKREYALLEEVGDSTGFSCSRHADAIAMSLWPSRGLTVIGFEVKCYRQDWLRELDKPEKADAIAKFCDQWWIVAPTDEMVPVSELPPTWGLYVSDGKNLVVKKQAPTLEPQPLSRGFVAAVLRKASDGQDALVRRAKDTALMVAREEFDAKPLPPASEAEAELRKEGDRLRKMIDEFEAKSGIKIEHWDAGRVGEAVARFRTMYFAPDEALERLRKSAKDVEKAINEEIKAMRSVRASVKPAEKESA
jgi:hypothetical protein